MSLPILTVIGATGAQGGSVVDSALAAGHYHVRAITRNTSSAKAQALRDAGAEVVSADLNDEASLVAAFAGSSAIYAVTDFFEPFAAHGPEKGMEIEISQGKNLANAAFKTPSLRHYIWSTLPNGKEISKGKYLVPHFEAKNKIDA
jgi:nucleoside-diphosphate-sugar epimerase